MLKKVTPEMVKENMQDVFVTTINYFKPTTVVQIRMKNGFVLTDSTSCVNPEDYSEEIGAKILLERMENKVWELLGYEMTTENQKNA